MALRTDHDHSPASIRARLASPRANSALKDLIYGAIDGAVTTFAIVSGVAGAQLSSGVIIVLGLANLIADGFSMAASNFLGTRAENQIREKLRRAEARHIREVPEGEREEIRQIFAAKGFEGDTLEKVVEVITADAERWVETMLTEEHGLSLEPASPGRAALATFGAFVVVGAFPLASYLVNWAVPGTVPHPFAVSVGLTGAAFFGVGALKGREVGQSLVWSGLETLGVGAVAAAIAYGIGAALHSLA